MGGGIPGMENAAAERQGIDWPHLIFLIVIAAATLWYLSDAMSVSMSADNLLLVAPLSGLAVLLCLALGYQCIRPPKPKKQKKDSGLKELGASELRSSDWGQLAKIGGVAAALGCDVFMLNVVGFDVATWGFALAVMLLCGERRPLALLIYPLILAGILIGGFQAMLPFPMYTTIL